MLGTDTENTVLGVHSDAWEARETARRSNAFLAAHGPASWICHVAGPYSLR
jgi:hypothetical protein